jgi:EAL domain-containing protein (putative c-di-GMP-specific phosphodiesterase class I)
MDIAVAVPIGVLERDRLARFFPALFGLTMLFAAAEATFAVMLDAPSFAAAACSTCVFALGLVVAAHQIRAGQPLRARLALAASLIVVGVVGTYLIPDVGSSTALLPIVSVVLILPHVSRRWLLPVGAAAVLFAIAILVLDAFPHHLPAIGGWAGTLFADAMLVSVVGLVLAGLMDFAFDASESLRDLRDSAARQLEATAERLTILSTLRTLHSQASAELTAAQIVTAVAGLPFVDMAAIMECVDGDLVVLAVAGREEQPIRINDRTTAGRADYLLKRSAGGAWAELWDPRPGSSAGDQRLTNFGVKGQACAPILATDDLVGLLIIATTDPSLVIHLVTDLPSVGESAAIAGAILGPALLSRRHLRGARVKIAQTILSEAFHPVFQPIKDLATGQTVGFEALTRFDSGEAPDRVFGDAERAGLGAELEAATLAAALGAGTRLPAGTWLSLNVSPAMLAEGDALERLLAQRTRPIVLEVTEHVVIHDYAPLHAALRRLGPDVRLAVDDAGAGAANFQHLVDLRPDIVKIDAGLIRGVNADVSRQALVAGLVHFAALAGAVVVAEGVETEAERTTVHTLGVPLAQGYLLARPAAIDQWDRDETPGPSAPWGDDLADVQACVTPSAAPTRGEPGSSMGAQAQVGSAKPSASSVPPRVTRSIPPRPRIAATTPAIATRLPSRMLPGPASSQ